MANVNTRVFFSKTGRAKFISHLDLYGVFQRAVRKAGLPAWYTEGLSPRLYLQFMLPLSLGQEGLREAVDLKLLDEISFEETAKRLSDALPHDIQVIEAAAPVMRNTDISSAEYEISGTIDLNGFREFCERDSITVEKKTKKGVSEIDLKPYISSLEISDKITLRLPAGNDFNINPALLLGAYEREFGKSSGIRIVRTRIFNSSGEVFR
ncbi:MAG: DUF2344 domain-containing protein [Oscillospiraceae bacterium]|nr:DUF2344 domain-containing protein [Oscillospiraceae bacterium]